MRILLHSKFGDGAGLAYLMKKEGHDVLLYIDESSNRVIMDGLVPSVPSLNEGLSRRPEVVLFDLSGDGEKADLVRKSGYPVIGASAFADKLEMDRSYGAKVAKQYGLKVPETKEFKKLDEAMAYVKQANKPLAIKINNNKSEMSSHVAKSAEDMLDYLNYSKEEGLIDGDSFVLQDVVSGAEVSTEGWFSNGEPLYPANSTWETKKFLAGELGQRTGCEVSLVAHYDDDRSKLYDQTIRKLHPLLKALKYTGPIDVNAIVSEKDHQAYFLEFTPRLGYSAIYGLAAILGMSLGEFFWKLARKTFQIPFKATWGCSLKVSVPPYPAEIENKRAAQETYEKSAGMVIKNGDQVDFVPLDAKKKGARLVTTGQTGIVGECLGRGESVLQAWRASQTVFKKIELPNKQGRYTDGYEDPLKRILKLRQWGFSDVPNPHGAKELAWKS